METWLDTASELLFSVLKKWTRLVKKVLGIYTVPTRRGVGGGANKYPRPQRRWRKFVKALLALPYTCTEPPYRLFAALQPDYPKYHGQNSVL